MAASDGGEIGVPQLERDGSREQLPAREPADGVGRDFRNLLTNRREVGQIFGISIFRAGRFYFPVGFDGPIVDAVGELNQPVGEAADRISQLFRFDRTNVHYPLDPAGAQLAGGDGSHAPQRIDRKLLQKWFDAIGMNHREAIRLLPARRDLREKFVRRHAGRRRQARLLEDALLQPPGNRGPQRLCPRILRHVEIGLVERQRLDEGRHVAEDPENEIRRGFVSRKIRRHDDELGTQPDRLRHRHRRVHAIVPRLVAGRRDDAALVRPAADRKWLAAQRWIVALLDRRIKRIHVDVKNPAHSHPFQVIASINFAWDYSNLVI